jgi:hypothetical protein
LGTNPHFPLAVQSLITTAGSLEFEELPAMADPKFHDYEPTMSWLESLTMTLRPEVRKRLIVACEQENLSALISFDPPVIRSIWFEGERLLQLDVHPELQ